MARRRRGPAARVVIVGPPDGARAKPGVAEGAAPCRLPTPPKLAQVREAQRRVAQRVGAKLRFHDLRHFSATELIGAGTDVRTVAFRLGHADPSTTLRVYPHALVAKDREAAAILGALVGQPSGPSAREAAPGLPTP